MKKSEIVFTLKHDVVLRAVRQVTLALKLIRNTARDFNINYCIFSHIQPAEIQSQTAVPTTVTSVIAN